MSRFTDLHELLQARSNDDTTGIGLISSDDAPRLLPCKDIFSRAQHHARALRTRRSASAFDTVFGILPTLEDHIVLFWACCIARVPYCPLPELHPDLDRQKKLLSHIHSTFGNIVLVTTPEPARIVEDFQLEFELINLEDLTRDQVHDVGHSSASLVSPEDVVLYVLTSGSTGNPKAVPLRHAQILASCYGKSQHHGTSSDSKFLNWIAFDHVASIIEIHVHALVVGASQYHISPAAIVYKPALLLQWCSRLRITYTFSPNFLLARILKEDEALGDLDLSGLRVFVSGGEAVPTTTGVAFANLLARFGAPRNVLRAGFGMSETCAGCIYATANLSEVADEQSPAYLTLGTCVPGVSMRIVDDADAVVPPGQPGHLQVAGGPVFKSYLNDSRATAAAFTSDGWFRTGDLALIDASSSLYLVGREKDTLNINGTKLSTTDAENYVAQRSIPGVSDVTVCPFRPEGAETETYLVFYQHRLAPNDDIDPRDIAEVLFASRAISTACTVLLAHAPHAILPLPQARFVRTALGKVSRGQLTSAFQRGEFAERARVLAAMPDEDTAVLDQNDPVERAVSQAVCEIFEFEPSSIRHSINLFDTGASSMHLMRLKNMLEERLGLENIPTIQLLRNPYLGDLCEYLTTLTREQSDDSVGPQYQPLVCLQSGGSKPPLFLVHPGLGEILVFLNLAHHLQDDRPIYALRAKGFDYADTPFGTLDETVLAYTAAIEANCPNGPYYVAGYSYGGAIAFEICKLLEGKGKTVAWLGILNLPPHIQFRMHELSWTEVLFNVAMFLSLVRDADMAALRLEFAADYPALVGVEGDPEDPLIPISWLLRKADQARLTELNLQLPAFARWIKVAYEINRTGRTFIPQGSVANALTTVFCAVPLPSMGTREEYKAEKLSEWKDFSGPAFELVDVLGEHYTMLSAELASDFAGKMRDAMKRAEMRLSAPSPTPAPVAKGGRRDFEEVPVIDFSLAESDPAAYYDQLRFALEDVGFLVFSNVPGFEDEFQKEVFDLARDLYSRPQEWKDSLGTGNSYSLRGYFRADTLPGLHKAHAEAYRFGAEMPVPSGDDVPFWLRLHEGPNQWPSETDLPRFREQMTALFARYHGLNLALNKHICRLLDLPEDALAPYFPAPKIEFNSAIWHYFPVTPEILQEAQNGFAQGMHEHRDPSTFVTCLIQSRPGLQVQNHQGEWLDVPMVKGGVVCNIGMQLMKLTGGKLVATTHRVNTLKIEEDRFTIPYVLSTRLEKEITPLPEFASPDAAKIHVAPNPKIMKLMAIEDPLVRSGYARLSLFPAATARLYPAEFADAQKLGIV